MEKEEKKEELLKVKLARFRESLKAMLEKQRKRITKK